MSTRRLSRTARFLRWFRSPIGAKLSHRAPGASVFSVGAYVSYWHIVEVARKNGERGDSAYLYPVIIDMMIVVSARYLSRARTRIGKVVAGLGFVAGAAATLYCNLLASESTVTGRIIGTMPGLCVIITASVLHWGEMRPKPPVKAKALTPDVPAKVNGYKHNLSASVSN